MYFAIFYSFHLRKKSVEIFLSIPHGKELTEIEKAQIDSLHAAGKSYSFIANHLHQSKGCIQDFVTKKW